MKLFSKKIPYSLKRIVPMAMLAGATMFSGGCKPQNEPADPLDNKTPVEPVVKVNKELYFTEYDGIQISFDTLNKYLAMDNIDTIYMIPVGTFFAPDWNDHPSHFKLARDNLLEERINLSPRIRGKGDFITNLGYPSQYRSDSLWMVENGWTVNKYWIDQLNQNTK